MLNASQAAKVLGCSQPMVLHLIKTGRLTAKKIKGRWQIHPNALKANSVKYRPGRGEWKRNPKDWKRRKAAS